VAVSLTPLQPADPGRLGELLQRLKLDTPNQMWDTVAIGHPDIRSGDFLVVDGRRFVIRAAAPWTPPAQTISQFMALTLEEMIQ
jgi:hypothetical protein